MSTRPNHYQNHPRINPRAMERIMTTNLTMRTFLVLSFCALLALCLGATPNAYAGDRYDWDDGEWDERPDGGGHGGAGATHVPIIDEDFKFMVTWTRDHIGADQAQARATGAGVAVAVLDGGFNLSHPDLVGHVGPGYDAIDEDDDPEDFGNGYDDDRDGYVDDGLGHGTFAAGLVLLAAPNATILPVRVRDDEGFGYDSELRRGLRWAQDHGADIVMIPGTAMADVDSSLIELVEEMREDGVAIIVSAGNEGVDVMDPLAEVEATLAVASTDEYDRLAYWSNFNDTMPTAMVMAPGVELYAAVGFPEVASSGYWSGTSFSAGLVAGAAALVLEQNPSIAPYDLYGRLVSTADPAYDENGALLPMNGRINLERVVD